MGGLSGRTRQSLQLWALPPQGGPRSLGVLGGDAVVKLTAAENQVRAVPALAVSLEPKGGVPGERGPTGPVLFKGAFAADALIRACCVIPALPRSMPR